MSVCSVVSPSISTTRHEAEHADKMRVLATLERLTKEAVAPALEQAGISTEPDAEMLGAADALADASRDSTWQEVMGSFEGITGQFIALYERIGGAGPRRAGRLGPAGGARGCAPRLRPGRTGRRYGHVPRSGQRAGAHALSSPRCRTRRPPAGLVARELHEGLVDERLIERKPSWEPNRGVPFCYAWVWSAP